MRAAKRMMMKMMNESSNKSHMRAAKQIMMKMRSENSNANDNCKKQFS